MNDSEFELWFRERQRVAERNICDAIDGGGDPPRRFLPDGPPDGDWSTPHMRPVLVPGVDDDPSDDLFLPWLDQALRNSPDLVTGRLPNGREYYKEDQDLNDDLAYWSSMGSNYGSE